MTADERRVEFLAGKSEGFVACADAVLAIMRRPGVSVPQAEIGGEIINRITLLHAELRVELDTLAAKVAA